MEQVAIWGGGIGGAIGTLVWALKAGGAWDKIPKWLRPLLFVGLAGVGAAAMALGGGATWSAAILAGLAGLTAARATYETAAGATEEKELAAISKESAMPKSRLRKAARMAKKVIGDRL